MAHDKLPSFYWRYSVILLWLFIVMLKFRKIYQPAGIAFPVGKKTQLPYISQNFYKVVNKNAVKTEFQSLYSIFFFSLQLSAFYISSWTFYVAAGLYTILN